MLAASPQTSQTKPFPQGYVHVLVALQAGIVALFVAIANLVPQEGENVLVIFRPGWSESATMHALVNSGGNLVRGTGWDWAFVANSSASGFSAQLYRNGAMMVVGGNFLRGCL